MSKHVVYVIDDDAAVRRAVKFLLESAGFDVRPYGSAESFMNECCALGPSCLLLDMRMPGMSGLDVQSELARRGLRLPIVFMTGHRDVSSVVQAMKSGALDVLTKPLDADALIEHVHAALARSEEEQRAQAEREAVRARLAALTSREREVLELAIEGVSNKDIARRLGISYRTVEVHRSRILSKTGATSLLELAHLARRELGH